MKNKLFATDERMGTITGNIAVIFLGLTQTALLVSTLYRRFGLDQSQEQYWDIRFILFLSVFGYLAARLFFGAILPVLSVKTLFGLYMGLVALLFTIMVLWMGLPDLQNWQNNILPVMAGPAILVIGYGLLAYFGNKRLEKELNHDEESK
jgi:hypothetical protein